MDLKFFISATAVAMSDLTWAAMQTSVSRWYKARSNTLPAHISDARDDYDVALSQMGKARNNIVMKYTYIY